MKSNRMIVLCLLLLLLPAFHYFIMHPRRVLATERILYPYPPETKLGVIGLNSSVNMLVLVTACTSLDTVPLISMLSEFRKNCSSVPIIVFDKGLSEENKKQINAHITECEIRNYKPSGGEPPSKAALIHSVINDHCRHGIIAWVDVGHLPSWDLRLVLDSPVGTSFIGELSNGTMESTTADTDMDNVSSSFFVMFLDFRFYSRVLLSLRSCHSDVFCSAFTKSLTAFKRLYRNSVLLNQTFSYRHRMRSNQENHIPQLIRINSKGLKHQTPFIACVTLFGPNNQLMMILHLASQAKKLGLRFLAPPLRSHYLRTERPGVSQNSSEVPADKIFSLHFLYKSAIVADSSSSWIKLLPLVDFIVHQPYRSIQTLCKNYRVSGKCTVKQLMRDPYVNSFFTSVGIHQHMETKINVILCKSNPEDCIRNSAVKRRRIPIIFWNSIGQIVSVRTKNVYPLLTSGHFQMPKAALERSIQHGLPCLSIHIRLKDTVLKGNKNMVGSVQESELIQSKCSDVMISGKQWGERTILDLVNMAKLTASRRNLTLYVLMPYHKPVFDYLATIPNVKTIQDFNLHGMSEVEVLLSDMALGATCDLFVPDAFSSLTTIISSMRGGVGLLSPKNVIAEGYNTTMASVTVEMQMSEQLNTAPAVMLANLTVEPETMRHTK